jgi:hypothetical protein
MQIEDYYFDLNELSKFSEDDRKQILEWHGMLIHWADEPHRKNSSLALFNTLMAHGLLKNYKLENRLKILKDMQNETSV